MTQTHVIIARIRLVAADSAVWSGQKYGFNKVNIADRERRFLLRNNDDSSRGAAEVDGAAAVGNDTKRLSPTHNNKYNPIIFTISSSPESVSARRW
jgi:hypothetical protein